MKIRTDFVTNSSSSCFSVVVKIQDNKGNTYSFDESPYEYNLDDGGTCWFNANLEDILIKNAVSKIKAAKETKYRLEDDGAEGRNARIENVFVGDQVTLVKTPVHTQLGAVETDYAIEVHSKEGSLGILPRYALDEIKDVMNCDAVLLEVTVSSVTSLSKRSKNAKYALISVSFDAEQIVPGPVLTIGNVTELAKFLMDHVHDDYRADEDWEDEDWDDEEEDESEPTEDFEQVIAARKAGFVKEVSENVSSINDIVKVSVHRDYSAWGEFADCIPDNDSELCELASRVNSTSGAEQEKALKDMLAYIRTSSPDRCHGSFGMGYDDIRYAWNGDKNDLLALAKRLCSGYMADIYEGREHDEIDLVSGNVESYAEFDLC